MIKKLAQPFFVALDVDKSGKITFDELKAGYTQVHAKNPEAFAVDVLAEFGKDKAGVITYPEFEENLDESKTPKTIMIASFLMMDKDKDGTLDLEEGYRIEEIVIGHPLTEEQKRSVKEAYETLDQDGDGKLDFEEYIKRF